MKIFQVCASERKKISSGTGVGSLWKATAEEGKNNLNYFMVFEGGTYIIYMYVMAFYFR